MARRWVAPAASVLFLATLVLPLVGAQAIAPEVSFVWGPSQPFAGDKVSFFDTTKPGSSPIVSRFWDFGDGSNSTENVSGHAYKREGLYTVALTVTDELGARHSATKNVDIAKPPEISLRFPHWLYGVMPAIASTTLLLLGLVVILRGQPTIYNRVFFLLCLASAIKGYTEGGLLFLQQSGGADATGSLAVFLSLINVYTAFFYAPIFLWFVLVFPRPIRPWLKNGVRGAWVLLLALPFFVVYSLAPTSFSLVFNVYVSILTLGALCLLVYHAWETDSEEERHRLRLLATTFFIIVFETILIAVMDIAQSRAVHLGHVTTARLYTEFGDVFGTILAPMLEIIGLFLVMYGILRYQLMGVEKVVKKVTRGAVFGITMFITFVAVGNTAEYFIEGRLPGNVPGGFLIAGFVAALAMVPIQKGSEKLANRWFPEAGSKAPDYLAQRRMEIYEAQLRYALLDGQLKDKELTMLKALSQSIEIRPQEMETVFQKFPGIDLRHLLGAAPTPVA